MSQSTVLRRKYEEEILQGLDDTQEKIAGFRDECAISHDDPIPAVKGKIINMMEYEDFWTEALDHFISMRRDLFGDEVYRRSPFGDETHRLVINGFSSVVGIIEKYVSEDVQQNLGYIKNAAASLADRFKKQLLSLPLGSDPEEVVKQLDEIISEKDFSDNMQPVHARYGNDDSHIETANRVHNIIVIASSMIERDVAGKANGISIMENKLDIGAIPRYDGLEYYYKLFDIYKERVQEINEATGSHPLDIESMSKFTEKCKQNEEKYSQAFHDSAMTYIDEKVGEITGLMNAADQIEGDSPKDSYERVLQWGKVIGTVQLESSIFNAKLAGLYLENSSYQSILPQINPILENAELIQAIADAKNKVGELEQAVGQLGREGMLEEEHIIRNHLGVIMFIYGVKNVYEKQEEILISLEDARTKDN